MVEFIAPCSRKWAHTLRRFLYFVSIRTSDENPFSQKLVVKIYMTSLDASSDSLLLTEGEIQDHGIAFKSSINCCFSDTKGHFRDRKSELDCEPTEISHKYYLENKFQNFVLGGYKHFQETQNRQKYCFLLKMTPMLVKCKFPVFYVD